jgi:DNA polymerase-3 subunit gamma/tau
MPQVLYRKYRPLTFSSVLSQEHVKTTLSNAVLNKRIGHAYLFTGPRGIGKTTLARIFARAINCKYLKEANPCNECNTCRTFLEGTSLDLMEIDAATHTQVEKIRDLIDQIRFAPTSATYKVIIIDEVHMLSKPSFNALLKTLEEPPKHAVFILATTEIQKVPETIISRTQRFDFKKVSIADLSLLIKNVCKDLNVEINDGATTEIAQAAGGSFRDSLSLLDQVINYSDGKITEELVEEVLGITGVRSILKFSQAIFSKNTKDALSFITTLQYDGYDLLQFYTDYMEFLRRVLLYKTASLSDFGYSEELNSDLRKLADDVEIGFLLRLIDKFVEAGNQMKYSAIQSLPIETAIVQICAEKNVTRNTNHETTVENQDNKSNQESSTVMDQQNNPPVIASVAKQSISAIETPSPVEGEAITSAPVSGGELEKILTNWQEILKKVKDYNHSLITSLKLAKPVVVEKNHLIILFPFKFHADMIGNRKNRIIIDQVIEDVTGLHLVTKPVVEKEWTGMSVSEPVEEKPDTSPANNDSLKSALNILGGEIEK